MTDLVRLLRPTGLPIVTARVDPAPGAFTPVGVMAHHTAAGTNTTANLRVLKHGRPGLSGPLCNLYITRSGVVFVICDGRANDSGMGSSVVLDEVRTGNAVPQDAAVRRLRDDMSGNRWFYDIELDNRGTGEPYPDVQIRSYVVAAATILAHMGRDAGSHTYHRRWTARKIDPAPPVPDLDRLIAAKLKGDDMDAHDPVDVTAHRLDSVRPWAADFVDQYVKDGGTSVPSSMVWPVYRDDLAWFTYASPMARRIAQLERRVSDLERGGGGGGVADHTHTPGGIDRG